MVPLRRKEVIITFRASRATAELLDLLCEKLGFSNNSECIRTMIHAFAERLGIEVEGEDDRDGVRNIVVL